MAYDIALRYRISLLRRHLFRHFALTGDRAKMLDASIHLGHRGDFRLRRYAVSFDDSFARADAGILLC